MNSVRMGRTFVGVILVIAGVVAGVYAGLWWAFIGGIVQVIDAAKATPVQAWDIAYGIARIFFAGFIGVVTAVIAVFPGFAMLNGK